MTWNDDWNDTDLAAAFGDPDATAEATLLLAIDNARSSLRYATSKFCDDIELRTALQCLDKWRNDYDDIDPPMLEPTVVQLHGRRTPQTHNPTIPATHPSLWEPTHTPSNVETHDRGTVDLTDLWDGA